jgi:hypothetical protein
MRWAAIGALGLVVYGLLFYARSRGAVVETRLFTGTLIALVLLGWATTPSRRAEKRTRMPQDRVS